MKKLALLASIIVFTFSCKKEKTSTSTPTNNITDTTNYPNRITIIDDGILYTMKGVRDDAQGIVRTNEVQGIWMQKSPYSDKPQITLSSKKIVTTDDFDLTIFNWSSIGTITGIYNDKLFYNQRGYYYNYKTNRGYDLDSMEINITSLTNNNAYGKNYIKGTFAAYQRSNGTIVKLIQGDFELKEAVLQ